MTIGPEYHDRKIHEDRNRIPRAHILATAMFITRRNITNLLLTPVYNKVQIAYAH